MNGKDKNDLLATAMHLFLFPSFFSSSLILFYFNTTFLPLMMFTPR